jgi:hypothetical protein
VLFGAGADLLLARKRVLSARRTSSTALLMWPVMWKRSRRCKCFSGLCRNHLTATYRYTRSPWTTSSPSIFSPRRSVACERCFPTDSKRRQCASIW